MSEAPRRTRKLLVELRHNPEQCWGYELLVEATGLGSYQGFGLNWAGALEELEGNMMDEVPLHLREAALLAIAELQKAYRNV